MCKYSDYGKYPGVVDIGVGGWFVLLKKKSDVGYENKDKKKGEVMEGLFEYP